MSRGFTHLSHFTEEYKALFGELPSETLHQRARNAASHQALRVTEPQ
jgi:AraC-like DNA-binding protein